MNTKTSIKVETAKVFIRKHFWLYVLKLEHGKYYVGITSKTPEIRYAQHVSNFLGAQWTKKHKPIELYDKHDLGNVTLEDAQNYENKVTRLYMDKRGFNNVRGGDLSYSDNFVKRFGYYYAKSEWEVIALVSYLMLAMLFFGSAAFYLFYFK